MKVYLSGDVVVVDKTGGAVLNIPQRYAKYTFIDSNVQVSNIITRESVSDAISAIQDQSGTAIGGEYEVQRYLSKFIFRADSESSEGSDSTETVDSNNVKFISQKIINTIDDLLQLHPPNVDDEIELGNFIYLIDAYELNLGVYSLVTSVDTAIHGISQNINKIITTQDNTDLITSTANLFFLQIKLEASGTNSQAIVMNGATGFESLDMKVVEFEGDTKYGTLTDIRQAFWDTGFSFEAKEGFTLGGTMSGGFTLVNSRLINTGGFILGAAPSLTLNSIRSNVNATVESGDVAFDFDFDNFLIDQGFQVQGARIDGDGAMLSAFTGSTDNTAAEKSRKSNFSNNVGSISKNSRIGGLWTCTVEVSTPLTSGVAAKILGTTVYEDMQHLSNTTDNAFVAADTNVIMYELDGEITLDAPSNVDMTMTVRKWDDSLGSYTDIATILKRVPNFQGGTDLVTFRPFVPELELSEDDRIELWITNSSNSQDVTMLISSFARLKKI